MDNELRRLVDMAGNSAEAADMANIIRTQFHNARISNVTFEERTALTEALRKNNTTAVVDAARNLIARLNVKPKNVRSIFDS